MKRLKYVCRELSIADQYDRQIATDMSVVNKFGCDTVYESNRYQFAWVMRYWKGLLARDKDLLGNLNI